MESYAGPRILVVLDPAVDGTRAVDLACLCARETHAEIHLACAPDETVVARNTVLERAAQLARLHHLKVAMVEGFEGDAAGAVLRQVRRLKPRTLVIALPRPRAGWGGVRRHVDLWRLLKRCGCEVILVRG